MWIKLTIPVVASLLGFLSSQKAWVTENGLKKISWSISFILLPCMIVSAMANITISSSLLLLPFSTICIVLGLFLVSLFYIRFKKIPRHEAGSLVAAFSSLEGGSIGLALVLLLFGPKSLPDFFVFDITHAVILFTFTYFIACVYGEKHQISWKFIRSFFFGSIPFSVIIGLMIHFVFGGLDSHVSTILNSIGYLILPAVMFVLGYRFVYFPQHIIPSFAMLLVKMIIGYGIAFLFVEFFNLQGYQKIVVLLSACLPPSFLVIIFAEEQGLAKNFLVTFLPVAAIASFFILYAIFSLLG